MTKKEETAMSKKTLLIVACVILAIFAAFAIPANLRLTPHGGPMPARIDTSGTIELPTQHSLVVAALSEADRRLESRRIHIGTLIDDASGSQEKLVVDTVRGLFRSMAVPNERLEPFAFLTQSDSVDIARWRGTLRSIEQQAGGEYLISLEVRPDLVSRRGGVPFTPLSCLESWQWDGKMLKLVNIESKGFAACFID